MGFMKPYETLILIFIVIAAVAVLCYFYAPHLLQLWRTALVLVAMLPKERPPVPNAIIGLKSPMSEELNPPLQSRTRSSVF